jgi:hypothetical protein
MPHGSKRLSTKLDQYIAKHALQRVLLSNQFLPNQLFCSEGGIEYVCVCCLVEIIFVWVRIVAVARSMIATIPILDLLAAKNWLSPN